MRRKTGVYLFAVGILGLWVSLFQSIDLAEAKDPDYPTKPITFYIQVVAGGTTDTASRAIIEAASKYLGQPFIPINKPGAGGAIAAMAVMNAKPDGYTLGVNVGSSTLIMPHSEECPYRDLSGFTLIMNFGRFNWPLFVRGDAPWKTWKELVEWARQNPRGVKAGITSARSMAPTGIAVWKAEQKEQVGFSYLVL